jgi:hypothetical protein
LLDDVAGLADRFVGISLALAQWPVFLRFVTVSLRSVHKGALDALTTQVLAIRGAGEAFVGVGATGFER